MITRYYDDLKKHLKPNKVLVLYGPRQVGKTTLLQSFLSKTSFKYRFDSGDNIRIQHTLGSQDFNQILEYVSGYDLIALDEAQRIPNIGLGLKIIADHSPGIRIIVTGSSSFELAGQIGEPLTGRKKTLTLFPLSHLELSNMYNKNELKDHLSDWLVFGTYPAVVTAKSRKEKISTLEEIAHSYLLKDVLELERIKGTKVLMDLLRLLAFQISSEVSFNEIGTQLGIDSKTVARYIDLLEKAFVLYNLRGFSRNLRKEIVKKSKYYFYDTGIRNAIVSNFNSLEMRDDIGKLWENFLVIERLKTQSYKNISSNNYFWRTWDQKELDWIEERGGKLFGFEFKYASKKLKQQKDFLLVYPKAKIDMIHPGNYLKFIGL